MTDSLQATENASQAVATAPRISKAFIESQIDHIMYVDGAGFVAAAECPINVNNPTGTGGVLRDEFQEKYAHHTVCMVTTLAGFTVIGHSAPASPANYDPALGRQFAYENAFRQLWPLFAFTMLELEAYGQSAVDWMNAGAAASPHPDGFLQSV